MKGFSRGMRAAAIAAGLGVAAVAAAQRFALSEAGVAAATMPAAGGKASASLQILENPNAPHSTAVVFAPDRQVFAVYHVDSASGEIMLRSVRNVAADLQLEQYNTDNPAPKDIRAMLQEAR